MVGERFESATGFIMERVLSATRCALASLVIAGAFSTSGVAAQALVNGDFASDLDGWVDVWGRPAAWNPEDALGDPASGSAQLSWEDPGNNATRLTRAQCVQIHPGQEYRVSALGRVLPDQPPFVFVRLAAHVHDNLTCIGEHTGDFSDPQFIQSTTWGEMSFAVPTQATDRAIRVWLAISKPLGVVEPVHVLIDDVMLTTDTIFAHGFEQP